jgi:hypothetical protein
MAAELDLIRESLDLALLGGVLGCEARQADEQEFRF